MATTTVTNTEVFEPTMLDASELGPTIVFAPHPDDESLGCGGLIALLARESVRVNVVIMTDGIGSHRNSEQFPPDRLRSIRKQEAIESLGTLGVSPDSVVFLDLPDEYLPDSSTSGFDDAVDAVHWGLRQQCKPETLVVPWRRDGHCDHEATWQIVSAAADRIKYRGRWLEYPVWLDDLGGPDHYPRNDEMRPIQLDISEVRDLKCKAIQCHRSQVTDLISDDPGGFRMTPGMLARFESDRERYLEPIIGR